MEKIVKKTLKVALVIAVLLLWAQLAATCRPCMADLHCDASAIKGAPWCQKHYDRFYGKADGSKRERGQEESARDGGE